MKVYPVGGGLIRVNRQILSR